MMKEFDMDESGESRNKDARKKSKRQQVTQSMKRVIVGIIAFAAFLFFVLLGLPLLIGEESSVSAVSRNVRRRLLDGRSLYPCFKAHCKKKNDDDDDDDDEDDDDLVVNRQPDTNSGKLDKDAFDDCRKWEGVVPYDDYEDVLANLEDGKSSFVIKYKRRSRRYRERVDVVAAYAKEGNDEYVVIESELDVDCNSKGTKCKAVKPVYILDNCDDDFCDLYTCLLS